MDQNFRGMFEAMKKTAEGLIAANEALTHANEGLTQANEGIKEMADVALQAREEHEDLGDTVRRLEGLVLEQTADIRALRDELRRQPPS